MIWFKQYTIAEINSWSDGNMLKHLDIKFEEIGKDYLVASMPVDERTVQPLGLLHGGASMVLVETIASVGATLVIDTDNFFCVGLEINGNHIKSVKDGRVSGYGKPIHIGKTTQIWQVKIFDQKKELTNISRMTLCVLKKSK